MHAAGWSSLLHELDGAGGGGSEAGLLRALAAPSASAGGGAGAGAGGACWADDALDLDAVFDLCCPHALSDAPAGASPAQDVTALLSEHTAQLSRALPQPPAWAAAGVLRCLDATHGADCSRCIAPPRLDVPGARVHLYSQHAGASGEKLLRRLLLACPEWSDARAREAAAAAAAAEGDDATASCARERSSPALRKGSMIALCRHWRYKCDVFKPESERASAAQAQAEMQAGARAAGVAGSAGDDADDVSSDAEEKGSEGDDDVAEEERCCDAGGPPAEAGGPPAEADLDGEWTFGAGAEGEGAPEWRCLDESHPAACVRCSRPPCSDAAAAACVLRGSRKRLQNGEKQLRASLCRTAEWRDPAARAAAAARLAAGGAPGTARAVAERDCSALRKLDMLRLCSLWRLRSDIWQARAEAPPPLPLPQPQQQQRQQRQRQRQQQQRAAPAHAHHLLPDSPAHVTAAPPELPGGPVPPPPPAVLTVSAVRAYLETVVAPAIRAFLYHGSIERVFDVAAALPRDAPHGMDAASCTRSAAVLARIHASAVADLARLRACAAALAADPVAAATTPASCLGAAAPPVAEGHVHMVQLFAAGMAENIVIMTAHLNSLGARVGRAANALEVAQLEATRACHVALVRLSSGMQVLLLRCRDGAGGTTYLAAACGVLELLAELARRTVLNELGRAEWARRRASSWRSRFFDAIIAVSGDMMPHRMAAALDATAPVALGHSVPILAGVGPDVGGSGFGIGVGIGVGLPQQQQRYPPASLGLAPFYSS